MSRPPSLALVSLALPLALLVAACEFGGSEESPGRKVPASLTWLSTTLRKPAAVKTASEGPSY